MINGIFISIWISLFLPTTSCDDSFDGGLQGVEIAPKVLTNVPYGNSRLSVWGHMNNPNRAPDKKKYFVMPVVMLLPKTAKCHSNVFTREISLQFKLVMWNEDIASAVLIHLRKATSNQQLQSIQITTLPMEQVRLVWANTAQQLSSDFKFNTEWKSYANQDNVLRFELVVSSEEICHQAFVQLQARPDSLGSLELQYVLHGTRASRKRITVTGQHVLQGKMYAKMKNTVGSDGYVFLNSEDLNKFTNEVVSTVTASSMTDSDYVDTGDSISLSKLIYDSLSTFKQATTTLTPKMWESTFWQDEFTRPDKLTKYLNRVMTKDEGLNHTVDVNEKYLKKEQTASISVGIPDLISRSASASGKTEQKTHISEDDLREWLKSKDHRVQWTGEKFIVKPFDVYRLNTQHLSQKQDIATTYVQVHQVQYTYNVKVSFPDDAINDVIHVSTAAINRRLDRMEKDNKKEMADRNSQDSKMEYRLKAQIDDLKSKFGSLNSSIITLDSLSKSHDALLTPLQRLRNGHVCNYFRLLSPTTYTCPANTQIGFCLCIQKSAKYPPVWPDIDGQTCHCRKYGKDTYYPTGICCHDII